MRNLIKLALCAASGYYVADVSGILDAVSAFSDSLETIRSTLSR